MTRDDITRMFHEAGESAGWKPGVGNPLVINYLTHFATLVAAAEREACAQVCEASTDDDWIGSDAWDAAVQQCAAAIRARSQA